MSRMKPAQHTSLDFAVPILVVLSRDQEFSKSIKQAAGLQWNVLDRDFDQLKSLITEPNVGLVVFDDQSVAASERGRALTEIRRCASSGPVFFGRCPFERARSL